MAVFYTKHHLDSRVIRKGNRGRIYLEPREEIEETARAAEPEWKPDVEFFPQALGFRIGNYGMSKWSDLFTPRQLVALTTLTVNRDALTLTQVSKNFTRSTT